MGSQLPSLICLLSDQEEKKGFLQSSRFIMKTTLNTYFILFLKLAVQPSMALNPKSSDSGAGIIGLCYVPHV